MELEALPHLRIRPALGVFTAVLIAATGCEQAEPVVDVPLVMPSAPAFTTLPPPDGTSELKGLVEAQIARDRGPLLEGLKSLDPVVAERAGLGLASLQDRAATTALTLRLTDERAGVARMAAFALGRSGLPEAAGHLLAALATEDDPGLRLATIQALGFTAKNEEIAAMTQLAFAPAELEEAVLAVARASADETITAESVGWLVGHLSGENSAVRTAAAYYFARSVEPSTWAGHADAVRDAFDQLAPNDPAVPYLVAGLATLGETDDTPRFAALTQRSGDWRFRSAAVAALRDRAGDRTALTALLEALNDPSPHVVEAAAGELARVRPALEASKGRVTRWIEDNGEHWQAVSKLFTGLAPLGEGPRILAWLDGLPPDLVQARADAIEALALVPGDAYLDRLFEAAEADADLIATAAYRGLSGHWGSDRGNPDLVGRYDEAFRAGLQHAHPTVVRTASRALTDPLLLARGSAGALESALLDQDPADPEAAPATAALVAALAQTRDEQWVTLVERYLAHPHSVVRVAAGEAIQSLTPGAPGHAPGSRPEVADLVVDWDAFPESRPTVVMETDYGSVEIVLDPSEAPLTVQTFLQFVDEGLYDGVPFHRVVPNFVVQGGDFVRRDGSGGPGYSIRTELTRIPFQRGVLGMASSGKDTEGSQFFIMHTRAPHLENRYTSFGWVVSGMDVVDQLMRGDRIIRLRRAS